MRFSTPDGPLDLQIESATVAGWTGRDAAAVRHHIDELAELGVAPPSTVPLYYRVAASLLTQAPRIEVLGPDTSGEAEPLIIRSNGKTWLGLASDHTDRALETVSVAASKQICAKPVASDLWPFEEVENHLDQLILTCDIEEGGQTVRYQEGALASILPLQTLIDGAHLGEGGAMLCGTLGAIGGVRAASSYKLRLQDPVLGRVIALEYRVSSLPQVS